MSSYIQAKQPENNCWTSVRDSGFLDIVLTTGFISTFAIGVVGACGFLDFMGAGPAAYFSYGMFAGSAVLFILQNLKVIARCCKKGPEPLSIESDEDVRSLITNLTIDKTCRHGKPCSHTSQLTLSDGRSVMVSMEGYEIYTLMQACGTDKITYEEEPDHFNAKECGPQLLTKREARNIQQVGCMSHLAYQTKQRNRRAAEVFADILSTHGISAKATRHPLKANVAED